MKRKLFIIIATLFPMLANAHDFEVDGIYYDILLSGKTQNSTRP